MFAATVTPVSPSCAKEWTGVCIKLGLGLCQMRIPHGDGVWVLRVYAGVDGKSSVMVTTPGPGGQRGSGRRQVGTSNGMFTLRLWLGCHSKGLSLP